MSEGFSHRRQQAPGQERQAETAFHFQRGATLHRGMFYSAAILNASWQFCAFALFFFGERLVLISISLFLFIGFLQNDDFTEERIRFGVESVYIDSWMRRRIYDAFKEIMESGVRHHLQVGMTHRSQRRPSLSSHKVS